MSKPKVDFSAAFDKKTIDNLPVSIVVLTRDAEFVYANKITYERLGYTAEELFQKRSYELNANFNKKEFQGVFDRMYAGPVPIYNTTHICKDGSQLPIEVHMQRLIIDGINYMLVTSYDITLKNEFYSDILEREHRLKIIADSIPVGIWMEDENSNFIYENRAARDLFQTPTRQLLQTLEWFSKIHEEDRKRFVHEYSKAHELKKKTTIEYRLLGNTGSYKWIITTIAPRYSNSEEFLGYIVTSINITNRKKSEEKKDEFLSIASHELKTPLTIIKGYSQILYNALFGKVDNNVDKYLDNTVESIQKLTVLVEELLDTSRIESGKMRYNFSEVSITELIKKSIVNLKLTHPEYKIEFKSEGNFIVNGDSNRLEQVLSNLINNAIKYSPNSFKIKITIKRKNDEVIVSVQDFGIGVANEDLNKLFQRFYRVESVINIFQGLGIGLYISSEIIKRHGGRMWVESTEGKGSTFYFSIPVSNAEE